MNGGVAAETGTSEADAAPASEQEQGHEPIVALAFDLVSLPITEMWKMEHYRRAMELLFDADEEEGEGEGEGGGDAPLDEEWDTASIMSGVQSASAAPAPGPGPASRTGAGNSTQAANSREAKGRKEEKEQVPVPRECA